MTHVMNYEEIKQAAKDRKVIWEEIREQEKVRPLMFNGTDFFGLSARHYLLLSECDEEDCPDYNWNYRVWNNMPTATQRKNEKWKEDPYKTNKEE